MEIDPATVKYGLIENRWIATIPIKGKRWQKAHLVYAYNAHLTLEEMQLLLKSGNIVHHLNKIPNDDRIANLELLTKNEHTILHHKGKIVSQESRLKMGTAKRGNQYCLGKTQSPEHRQKRSNALKGEKNYNWVKGFPLSKAKQLRDEGLSFRTVGTLLGYPSYTVRRRIIGHR